MDEEWLEVRRFDGPVEAEMARAFLLEHGVRAMLRGPSTTMHSLVRFAGSADVRLLVPDAELEAAREALAALFPETTEMPFRGAAPRADAPRDDARAAPPAKGPRPRNVLAVLLASSVLPIAAAHLTEGCRANVVTRRRASPDFALAPAAADEALPPAFAGQPSLGNAPR